LKVVVSGSRRSVTKQDTAKRRLSETLCPRCGARLRLQDSEAFESEALEGRRGPPSRGRLTGPQLFFACVATLLVVLGAALQYHGQGLGGQIRLFGYSLELVGLGLGLNLLGFLIFMFLLLGSLRAKR
jgi:hypothetical protein